VHLFFFLNSIWPIFCWQISCAWSHHKLHVDRSNIYGISEEVG
jgi:hypothetical protein